jgi:orotate phosphoribosyltransferase
MLIERSMRFGGFVLSSGGTSNCHVHVSKTGFHPQGLQWISRLFRELLEPADITAMGGLTMGAAQVFQQRGYPFTPLFTVNDLLFAERG